MASRLERTERLLNLVFCLMAATRPVPRATIRATVAGYDPDASTEAFERMFERDKEELRGMGIPIDTVLDVNGDVAGYRILPARYRLMDIHLSAEERTAVALAARVWDGASLSEAASQAVLKLAASGDRRDPPIGGLPQFARLTADDAHLLPILRSAREGRAVAFTYRGLNADTASRRFVDPWAVVARSGKWYLIGFDRERQAPRAFRLSRIDAGVELTSEPLVAPRPEGFRSDDYINVDRGDQVTVRVTLAPGGGAELLRRGSIATTRDGGADVTITGDRETILGLIMSSYGYVESVVPSELLDDATKRLRAVVDAHGGSRHGA